MSTNNNIHKYIIKYLWYYRSNSQDAWNGTTFGIQHPDGVIFTVTIRFPEFYARGLRKFDKLMFLVVIRQKTNCCCIPRAETAPGTKFQLHTLFH